MDIHTINSTSVLSRCMRFIGAMLAVALMIPAVAFSQPFSNPLPVPLLTAGTYGALAYSGITGSATVNGDIGTSTASIDGSITQTGTNWGVGGSQNLDAQTDLTAALTNASGRPNDATIAGDALGGQTLGRGVYTGGALDLASGTTLTFDGNATDIFIIKAASTLTINTNSSVSLTGGAVWSNVYWYVGSSATIFSGTTFNGIILAVSSITVNASATQVTAQLLANTGAVTINSNILPVELISFTAASNNGAVELNWNTATEVNNYGFEIERKTKNKRSEIWEKIGFVPGSGNSNSPKDYSFSDSKTLGFGKYGYRLKQLDTDGKYEYSKEVGVDLGLVKEYALSQNYPNPFNPSTIIKYTIPQSGNVKLSVYNILGAEVTTLVNEFQEAGVYTKEFSVNKNGLNLSNGVYIYKLETGNFTDTKKFILMK